MKGFYGNIDGVGDLIGLEIERGKLGIEENSFKFRKEVFICLDISGSMEQHIEEIKELLISFQKSISHNDFAFRKYLSVKLVLFNNKIKEIWNYTSRDSFNESLEKITCQGLSDFYQIHKYLKSEIKKYKATWVLWFTDGRPSKGKYRISDSFKKNKINNVNQISFGFGKCNTEIMKHLGNFIYNPNSECMEKLGKEILEMKHYNYKIRFVSDIMNKSIHEGGIILDELPESRYLIGNSDMLLSNSVLYSPYGNIKDKELISSYKIIASYQNIGEENKIIDEISLEIDNDKISELYENHREQQFYKGIYDKMLRKNLQKSDITYNNGFCKILKQNIDYLQKSYLYKALFLSQQNGCWINMDKE